MKLKVLLLIPVLLISMSSCSSTTGSGNTNQFSGWASISFDNLPYTSNEAHFGGRGDSNDITEPEFDISSSFSLLNDDYSFQIYLKTSHPLRSIPAGFTIDSSLGNIVYLSPNEPYNVSFVADSGQVFIASQTTDSLAGSFVLRLRGSDSSVHLMSGEFIAGPPAVP